MLPSWLHYDETYLWTGLGVLVVSAFVLGRKSVKTKSLKYTLNKLHYLHKDLITHTDKKLMYERWHLKLSLLTKLIFGLYLVFGAGLLYLKWRWDMFYLSVILLSLLLFGLALALGSRSALWMQKASETWINNLTEQIQNEKQVLLVNVGSEVVDLIKESQDCKPSCRLIKKCHLQDIERYKTLLTNIQEFQWCSGCATDKGCTAGCGGKFWKLSRSLVRDFKAKAPSVVNSRIIPK